MIYLGIWVLSGCIVSLGVYLLDIDRFNKKIFYADHSYILFVVICWPIVVALLTYFMLVAMVNSIKSH